MSENKTVQPVLDKIGEVVQGGLGSLINSGGTPAKKLKNLLNGVWLGHALHPAMTDIPVGCWMVSTTFDLLSGADEKSDLAPGADAALGLGILGSVGAALSGLADWSDTYGEERTTGTLHMLLNTGALTVNCASWLLRRNGQRKLAVLLSATALGATTFSAYLGGEMSFKLGSMVNHLAWTSGPEEWTEVMQSSDLQEGQLSKAEAGDVKILLVKQGSKIEAVNEVCPHAGAPLSEGKLENGSVICPWHGSRFCLANGKVEDGPSTYSLPTYDVREVNGKIEVRQRSKS